jgi:hypothetical protein
MALVLLGRVQMALVLLGRVQMALLVQARGQLEEALQQMEYLKELVLQPVVPVHHLHLAQVPGNPNLSTAVQPDQDLRSTCC